MRKNKSVRNSIYLNKKKPAFGAEFYLPVMTQDKNSVINMKKSLKIEMKKKNVKMDRIDNLMNKTYESRRNDIVVNNAPLSQFKEDYGILFTGDSQVS